MRAAFLAGQSENDPSASWRKGELWIFDHQAAPLVNKHQLAVGVLGASSNERLVRVEKNCEERAERGHQEVEIMKESAMREDVEIGGLVLHL